MFRTDKKMRSWHVRDSQGCPPDGYPGSSTAEGLAVRSLASPARAA